MTNGFGIIYYLFLYNLFIYLLFIYLLSFIFIFLLQGKRRRAQADFPGAEIILRQIKEKAKRKRVGLVSKGPPARGKEGVS